jgi:Glycosyl transferases group 1
MDSRVPLFINRFSLSPRTAIGVQTLRLLEPHQDWLHFHWWSSGLKQLDPRSVLFENTVLSRYSFLHKPKLMRICELAGISSWIGGDLRPSLAKQLTEDYQQRVSCTYVAPLDESDAKRCLELTRMVGAPYVLHLWDVLHGDVSNGALRRLIDSAERVFCVSEPLLRDVSLVRSDAELLSFSRDAACVQAKAPEGGPLRVVMHGNISSYAEGLDDLNAAITLLERVGVEVEVSFLGSPKILRQADTKLKKRVKTSGFFPTQQDVDRELAKAHVAFLPGPKPDPKNNLRSRYSIPSRVLDYMAVHLPIVGSVHNDSATASFVRTLGLVDTTTCSGPKEIAEWLMQLSRPDVWAEQSARSRDAFERLQRQEQPPARLKRVLDRIV